MIGGASISRRGDCCGLDGNVDVVTFRTPGPVSGTDRCVSSLTDVRASNSVDAWTRTRDSNLAKFICDQIIRVLMCTALGI
jgi:hypothetical protein